MTVAPRWTYVCRVADIVPNTGVCAKVGVNQVAVFRLVSPAGDDEGVYAIDNFEPRSAANVLSRGIIGEHEGELWVASPLKKQHFRLRDGHCLENAAMSVQSYPVEVRDQQVWVAV